MRFATGKLIMDRCWQGLMGAYLDAVYSDNAVSVLPAQPWEKSALKLRRRSKSFWSTS